MFKCNQTCKTIIY